MYLQLPTDPKDREEFIHVCNLAIIFDLEGIKVWLKQGGDINRNYGAMTVIAYLAEAGKVSAVNFLLTHFNSKSQKQGAVYGYALANDPNQQLAALFQESCSKMIGLQSMAIKAYIETQHFAAARELIEQEQKIPGLYCSYALEALFKGNNAEKIQEFLTLAQDKAMVFKGGTDLKSFLFFPVDQSKITGAAAAQRNNEVNVLLETADRDQQLVYMKHAIAGYSLTNNVAALKMLLGSMTKTAKSTQDKYVAAAGITSLLVHHHDELFWEFINTIDDQEFVAILSTYAASIFAEHNQLPSLYRLFSLATRLNIDLKVHIEEAVSGFHEHFGDFLRDESLLVCLLAQLDHITLRKVVVEYERYPQLPTAEILLKKAAKIAEIKRRYNYDICQAEASFQAWRKPEAFHCFALQLIIVFDQASLPMEVLMHIASYILQQNDMQTYHDYENYMSVMEHEMPTRVPTLATLSYFASPKPKRARSSDPETLLDASQASTVKQQKLG